MSRLQDKLAETSRLKHGIDNTIQDLKQSYREGEAGDRTMEFLLSQRSLKGYYGTLRQLGRIDDSYDIAAGVASNAWGFHVVEDRATATAALQLLKEHNIGRATMMVISEIEKEMGARSKNAFTAPTPKCKRLFDLIQPTNEKFKSVFYQAVRDTLVVDTLVAAREVAFGGVDKKRYRVVTLKGELVEPSGSITGGGATPERRQAQGGPLPARQAGHQGGNAAAAGGAGAGGRGRAGTAAAPTPNVGAGE
ncbi:SMC proteins Flexible Hinge Domain, putative [Angomonas deanei]|uniref:SMC proteins Flexible Hinge Domain, putative n=1 Tax=Angomonas deanei TaxID=59799 RepID=A0A7G2CMJ2_9TRYP|nr:SMC proteins Flexible Hinge Domain, putative [Angomonas deanei]